MNTLAKRRARRLSISAALSLAVLAGCGSSVVPIGSHQTPSGGVDPRSLTATVGSCPSGSQHPNVCCDGTGSSAACGASITQPLSPCPGGMVTHPDPLWCCSAGDGTCTPAPSSASGASAVMFCDSFESMVMTSSSSVNLSYLCGCTQELGSHSYAMNCSDDGASCACRVDGVTTQTLPYAGVRPCPSPGAAGSLGATWSACGFPG